MIDYFSLALTHALIAIALWRLLSRDELDVEVEGEGGVANGAPAPRPWANNRSKPKRGKRAARRR